MREEPEFAKRGARDDVETNAAGVSFDSMESRRVVAVGADVIPLVLFYLLFISFYVSPRNPFSLLGFELAIPVQYFVFGLTVLTTLVLILSPSLDLRGGVGSIRFVSTALLGSAGITFAFARSLEATGWSRPTLDLASMLFLVPAAYLLGLASGEIKSGMLWAFLSLFFVQFLWAFATGPNQAGVFTFYSVHSIEFGLMMATAGLVGLTLFIFSKIWYSALIPSLFLAGVFSAGSRGVLLGFFVGASLILVLSTKTSRSFVRSAFGLAGATVSGWLMANLMRAAHSNVGGVVGETIAETVADSSYPLLRTSPSGRTELWPLVMEKLPPGVAVLWGSGDSYVWFWDTTTMTHPHNLFLAYGVTGGVISLSLVGLFLAISFWEAVAKSGADYILILLAGLLALWAVHLQFNGGFGDGANLFLLAGFGLGRAARATTHLGAEIKP